MARKKVEEEKSTKGLTEKEKVIDNIYSSSKLLFFSHEQFPQELVLSKNHSLLGLRCI